MESPAPFQSELGQTGLAFIELKQLDPSWKDSVHRTANAADIRRAYGPQKVLHTVQGWDHKTATKVTRKEWYYHPPAFTYDEVICALDRRRNRAFATDDPMHLWDAASATYSEQQIRDALTGQTAPVVEIDNEPPDDYVDEEDIDPSRSWG